MNTPHDFKPFARILAPVLLGAPGEPSQPGTPGISPETVLAVARDLGGQVDLLGLVSMPAAESLSHGASLAREMRQQLEQTAAGLPQVGALKVRVSHHCWQELVASISEDPPDLLLLEYPAYFDALGLAGFKDLANLPCDVAVVRGPWARNIQRVTVPLRGGPYAQLALRAGLALPRTELLALHLSQPGSQKGTDAPFRGLARVLPRIKNIKFRNLESNDPPATIMEQSAESDVLILGLSARIGDAGPGDTIQRILDQARCAVLMVKTSDPLPESWTGPEGERSGGQAISLLVDQWFAENTYHADEFSDLQRLVALKKEQGVTISLALPALNEEGTVGNVIATVRKALMEDAPLLDEIVLVDSNSTDRTRDIAAELGVPVYIHQQLLPLHGARRGKGEALWKSLLVTHGDIIVWIDTDIVNIHPRFVYGVIGPMLANPALQFVKGFYQRPLKAGEMLQAGGGGRVTELTARPLINMFYPELSGVIQPLAGEYGGRRKALEQLSFFSGYGVEIGLLIDAYEHFSLNAIAQVDLLERVHHNQDLEALSKMSFTIMQAVIRKLEGRYNRPILEEVNKSMKLIRYEHNSYFLDVAEVAELERPPMLELPEYCQRQGKPR